MIKSFKQQKDISLGLKKYLKLSDPNSSPTSCQQHQKLDKLLATGVEWIHHTLMEDKKGKIQVQLLIYYKLPLEGWKKLKY